MEREERVWSGVSGVCTFYKYIFIMFRASFNIRVFLVISYFLELCFSLTGI